MADAGRRFPASADFQDADNASWRARRSSSVEIVAFIVDDQLHNRAFGQRGWLVENETSLLNTRSERTHPVYSTVFLRERQDSAVRSECGARSPAAA
jgi:hypothetical protein